MDYCINTANDSFMSDKNFVNVCPVTSEILWHVFWECMCRLL